MNLKNLNLGKIKKMNFMFQNCVSLTSIDLPQDGNGPLTSLFGSFQNCYSLKNLDLSCLSTGKVINMASMFKNCE